MTHKTAALNLCVIFDINLIWSHVLSRRLRVKPQVSPNLRDENKQKLLDRRLFLL